MDTTRETKRTDAEEADMTKRRTAFERLMQTITNAKETLPADFDTDKARYEALEEKYGPFA
jgi:hypothetical protein